MTRFAFAFLMLVPLLFTPKSVGEGTTPNLNKTLEVQRQLIGERPYNTEVHNDLGNLLVLAGHYDEAESAYGRALELDPLNTSAQFNLGLLLQQDGRLKDALRAFEAVMATDASHAWATYQAGVVFHERGKRRDALEHYARAFALDFSLTFAETNPHIIDNRLATEALLLSEKFAVETNARMPRLYGEPDRIVDLMLEMEDAEDAKDAEEQDAEDDEDDGEPALQQQGRRLQPRALEDDEGEQAAQQKVRGARDDEDDEDERPARRGAVQVVGGSVVGSATAAPADRGKQGRGREARAARRGAQPGRGATVTGGGARNPQRENTLRSQSPNRSRYRPATTSTGRLEMELLPEEDPERVTR